MAQQQGIRRILINRNTGVEAEGGWNLPA